MAQGVLGPNWPMNYIPSPAEIQAAFSAGAVGRALIQSMPCSLKTMMIYGVRTSLQPFTCILPPINTTTPGDWIMLYDADYNANANPVTLTATGPDNIACYGSAAPTLSANVADFMVMLIANPASWRAIVKLA